MADLTLSVACLSQKNEHCSNLPSSCECGSQHGGTGAIIDKVAGRDDAVCSKLCKSVEGIMQYNGNLQDDADFAYSTDSVGSVLNFSDHSKDNGHHMMTCASQSYQEHVHTNGHENSKCLEKCNGLTNYNTTPKSSSGNNSLLINILNMCDEEAVDTEIHEDSNWGSRIACHHCQCTKVDSDYVSCDEIEIENIRSPEVHCNNDLCGVETLLTDFEKTSIHHGNNSSEQCIVLNDVIKNVTYVVYESEKQMPDIMRLITKDLSEPYSIYTYRYFIHNWSKLCFLALCDTKCVGAIVCKLDLHKKMVRRGYIAMLAVDSEYRRRKIGSTLVTKAIEAMIKDDCDEVVLETEITNQSALQLYENLGFVRDKRLFRYYLNGVDALRLKLWLR